MNAVAAVGDGEYEVRKCLNLSRETRTKFKTESEKEHTKRQLEGGNYGTREALSDNGKNIFL